MHNLSEKFPDERVALRVFSRLASENNQQQLAELMVEKSRNEGNRKRVWSRVGRQDARVRVLG